MAIDTDGKKASLLNMGTPWYVLGPLVSTWSQDELQHLLHLYSGILAVTSVTLSTIMLKCSDVRPATLTAGVNPLSLTSDVRPGTKTAIVEES